MATKRWKVTLILDLDCDSHPRKFVPENVSLGLQSSEDLTDYEFEEVSDNFELLSTFEDT